MTTDLERYRVAVLTTWPQSAYYYLLLLLLLLLLLFDTFCIYIIIINNIIDPELKHEDKICTFYFIDLACKTVLHLLIC